MRRGARAQGSEGVSFSEASAVSGCLHQGFAHGGAVSRDRASVTEGEHDFLSTESISGHAHDFLSSTSISNDRVALFQGKVANSEGGFGEFGRSGFQDFMSRSIVGDMLPSNVDTIGAVSVQPRKQP